MATFKAEIYKHHKKSDGSYNVKIRVTHKSKKKYLSTSIFVFKDDLTKSLAIKNADIIENIEFQIRQYYKDVASLGSGADYMTVDDIVDFIQKRDKERFETENPKVDFFAYMDNVISNLESENKKNTAVGYKSTKSALIDYVGDSLYFSDMTSDFMKGFEFFLKERGTGSRGVSLYTSLIRTIFNSAIAELNDNEKGISQIKFTPFSKYKIVEYVSPEKRSISVDDINLIRKLEVGDHRRKIDAGEVFLLSFYLCGINAKDLFTCTEYKNGRIIYYRSKTTGRRKADKAKMSVKVPDICKDIFLKYRDKSGDKVFSFSQLYTSDVTFRKAINEGLKPIGRLFGNEGLEFYSARHTFASIARNKCKLPMDYVSKALNHSQTKYATTDVYIDEDWSIVDEVQKSVIRYIIKEASKKKAEK